MKVLTIIISYQFMRWADQCLSSMLALKYPTDLLVIDNGSKDETVAYLRQHYPKVRVIENGCNLGFGKANNIGIHFAIEQGYDMVLLLNQDAWLEADALGKLVAVAEKHPEYGIVSPVHLTGKGDTIEKGFSTYTGLEEQGQLPQDTIVEVPFINAAIWLVSIPTLRKTGLFAPLFYHYGEDKDLANRMSYHHYKIGYVPAAFGFHDRADRVENKERIRWSEYVYHLSEYANVNHSFGMAFAKGVLALVKKALSSAVGGRWDDAGWYMRKACVLTSQSAQVIKARKLSKHVDLKKY